MSELDSYTTDQDLKVAAERMGIPLNGVFSKDRLPRTRKEGGWIINLMDAKAGSGSHWTALYIEGKRAVYFDSFGFPPPKDVLKFCKGLELEINNQQVQNENSGYCGSYSLLFLYIMARKRGSLRMFQRLFSDDVEDNLRILRAFFVGR